MHQHNKVSFIGITLLAFASIGVAKPTKQDTEPYYFVADSVTYLSKAHTITYIGHVKVDQGQTHITGNRLVLDLTASNKVTRMVDTGHPATYITQLKNRPGLVHAKADKITYDQIHQMVYLDGHAYVDQNHNTIRAAHIRYDKKNGVIHTRGTPHQTATHIMVMPTGKVSHKKTV
jgi:lipopolysaccharide transport protein LptA